jgi:cation diffusion facilitator CzcD-associated flavoprotein CzcO
MPAGAREVVVIGAGPAGLAAAGALRLAGIDALVLDRAAEVGSSWRSHYDRLHLHTVRWLSGLPGLAIPISEGPWVSRDGVIRYLEAYAAHHRIEIRSGFEVTGIEHRGGAWEISSPNGPLHAHQVIVATGYNHTALLPDWPGRESFTGELLHASRYRNGEPYAGRDVLVVGAGNTGAEIAVDLAEHGARRVRLAYRTPPYVMRRSLNGVPAQVTGVLLRYVPTPLADKLAEPVRKLTVPDLTSHGLPDPGPGLYSRARRGEIPILDVGLIEAIQSGRVSAVPAVTSFNAARVGLADGTTIEPEAVIVATGYRRGLEPLVGPLGVLGEDGRPVVHAATSHQSAPGLRFIGYTNPVSGMFREIAIDARRIARAVRSELTAMIDQRSRT